MSYLPQRPREIAVAVVPLLVSAAIMLPRLLSPHFGFLDDGGMLATSQQFLEGDGSLWDVALGRFRPIYWLYWVANYIAFGTYPLGYFTIQTLLFLLMLAVLMLIVRRSGGSWVQASLSATLLAASPTLIENAYTLSKAEPLQLLLLELNLLALLAALRRGSDRIGMSTWVGIAGISLLAMLTKETALVLFPIALIWTLLDSISNRLQSGAWRLHSILVRYTAALAIASAVYLAVRIALGTPTFEAAGYLTRFEFSLNRFGYSGIRYAAWLIHDFAYVVPLAMLSIVVVRRAQAGSRRLLAAAATWAGLWSVIYLPWLFVQDYYLLPAALGLVVLAPVGLAQHGQFRWPGRSLITARVLTFVLAVPLWLAALSNAYAIGASQLTIDRENAALVRFLANESPESTTVGVALTDYSEYVPQMEWLLGLRWSRPDISTLQVIDLADRESLPRYIAVPVLENQRLLSPRMGFHEAKVPDLQLAVEGDLLDHGSIIYASSRSVAMLTVDFARAGCDLIRSMTSNRETLAPELLGSFGRFCGEGAFVDESAFKYGWMVYELVDKPPTSVGQEQFP